MRPISTPSSVNKPFATLLAGSLLAAASASVAIAAAAPDSAGFAGMANFQETIEKRCTVCHSRERVDAAMRAKVALGPLLQHMIERGAVLNERDRSVLGTFWGSPLKSGTAPAR